MPTELFFNAAFTTVAASQGAVAQGTTQSWTVVSSALFKDYLLNTAATSVAQFRVVDPADVQQPPEIILVTNVAGTTWSVTRGADGTTPTAHTGPFTVQAIITSQAIESATTLVSVNAQTTGYTIALSDIGKSIDVTSASAVGLTVPPQASVAFPIGSVVSAAQLGGGQVTWTPGVGVTVNTPSTLSSRTQYSTIGVRYLGSDTWLAFGDLT